MRQVRSIGMGIAAAATILLAAGCSGHPNNLKQHDQASVSPTHSRTSTHRPVPTTTTTTSPREQPAVPTGALMTGADVASEGVRPIGTPRTVPVATLPGCDELPSGGPQNAIQGRWRYPTGSTLGEEVLAYPAGRARAAVASVARGGLNCGADSAVTPPGRLMLPQTASDAQVGWCVAHGPAVRCAAEIASNRKLALVTVSAGSQARAAAAVQRLTPQALRALAGGPR